MRNPWRKLAFVLCAALLLSACTGVTPQRTEGERKADDADSLITIRVLASGISGLDGVIAAFQQKYPHYRVEKVTQPSGDLYEQRVALLREGKVDLLYTGSGMFAEENLLLPLDPWVAKTGFDLAPYGPLIDDLRKDGALYHLPYEIDPQMLAYNPDLFKEAGITPPQPGWTWEEFRTAAGRLTKGSGESKVWGFSTTWPGDLAVLLTQDYQAAGRPQEQAVREAFQFFATMAFTDKSLAPAPDIDYKSDRLDPGNREDHFKAGKAGMTLTRGVRALLVDPRTKANWDIAQLPTLPGVPNSHNVWAQTYGIAASTPVPEAAWEFLRFVAGPEGAAILAGQADIPVYQVPEVRKAWFDRRPAPPPGTDFLFTTRWRQHKRASFILQNEANRLLAGQTNVEQALAEWQARQPKSP